MKKTQVTDTQKTIVIFRKWNKKPNSNIALFPEDMNNNGVSQSYEQVGQHGGVDYAHCIKATTPATFDDYKELAEELESIGYDLVVRKRW